MALRRIITSVRRKPLLALAFGLAVAVLVVFGARFFMHSTRWDDPKFRDQKIEAWMTPGFVGHSWHVPKEVVFNALDLTKDTPKVGSLDELADLRGVPVEDLIQKLEIAIAVFRSKHD
ncbi:hypothetical protein [Pseudoprimorskyibacter insulae]|uniref:Uncharacterized protein n=1 Tax=Pseudoprimorskyibacter insulae TaxID=1695997 RepID=A0A2R8AYA1_9RHOB|nr:hypothetical protein [Pseudoprimorskyibacter insulae]SPF81013.1 hypothetical protein PRI8871_02829 [Pseudoprimorskyibacter insulae]